MNGRAQGSVRVAHECVQGLATMLAPVPNRNAMARARIDVFPVELMDFEIR